MASLLFLGKQNDDHCAAAVDFCVRHFDQTLVELGQWGDSRPATIDQWKGDYIISYLSRWIIPGSVLQRASRAAINFHPGPPEYPGIGCNNFALYDNAAEYGVTCHHMAPDVDTGPIVLVRRFPVFPSDNVSSLLRRTYDYQLAALYDVVGAILAGKDLPSSTEQWKRKPFTRREFNELFRITPEMSSDEVARRVRATSYEDWKPYVDLHGFRFEAADS